MPLFNVNWANVKQVAYTPVLAGAIGYAGSRWWLGLNGSMRVLGYQIETNLGMAAVIAASSFVGEVGNTYILPMIPRLNFLQGFEGDVIAPAVTGLATYGTMMTFGSADDVRAVGASNVMILGAASHFLARKSAMLVKNFI